MPLKGRVESRERLYRVALAWCGDEVLADDPVQDTLACGITKRRQLRDGTRLLAWLYTILDNKWQHHLRSRREHETPDERVASRESGPFA